MPLSHLLPDSQLVFSAELAAAAGLEEAVMLQQIRGLYLHQPATQRDALSWLHISEAYLLQLLPFWKADDLRRICRSLENLGLICVDRQCAAAECLLLAINDKPELARREPGAEAPPATPANAYSSVRQRPESASEQLAPSRAEPERAAKTHKAPPRREGQPLPLDFQPSEDNLEILAQFHGIPRDFALQQLEDFMLYWRERGSAAHAWQNKFKQHVQFKWAKFQQDRLGGEHAGQQDTGAARRTRDSSLEQDLTDTSWAE